MFLFPPCHPTVITLLLSWNRKCYLFLMTKSLCNCLGHKSEKIVDCQCVILDLKLDYQRNSRYKSLHLEKDTTIQSFCFTGLKGEKILKKVYYISILSSIFLESYQGSSSGQIDWHLQVHWFTQGAVWWHRKRQRKGWAWRHPRHQWLCGSLQGQRHLRRQSERGITLLAIIVFHQ